MPGKSALVIIYYIRFAFATQHVLTSLFIFRKPFISGNWKLNPQTKAEALTLASDIAGSITDSSPDCDVALFVPYVFIESAMGVVGDKLNVGAEVCNMLMYAYLHVFCLFHCKVCQINISRYLYTSNNNKIYPINNMTINILIQYMIRVYVLKLMEHTPEQSPPLC